MSHSGPEMKSVAEEPLKRRLSPFLDLGRRLHADGDPGRPCNTLRALRIPLLLCSAGAAWNGPFNASIPVSSRGFAGWLDRLEDELLPGFGEALTKALGDDSPKPAVRDTPESAIDHVEECLRELRGRKTAFTPEMPGELYLGLRKAVPGLPPGEDGLVYTPAGVARHMIRLVADREALSWVDPACGCGIFLRIAAELGPAGELAGMDLDPLACILCRGLLREGDGNQWPSAVEAASRARIIQGDALRSRKDLPPGWLAGFDRVVMNPPYRNAVERPGDGWRGRRAELKNRFHAAAGTFDLFVPFIERGIELLKPGGLMAAVVPDKWLAAPYGRELRRLLAAECELRALEHAPRSALFHAADFEPLVMVLRKGREGRRLRVTRLGKRLETLRSHRVRQGQLARYADQGWGPLLREARRRYAAPGKEGRLGDRHRVSASLSAGEFYRLEVGEAPEPARRGRQSTQEFLPLLTSGAIDPFVPLWGTRPSRFRGATLLRPVAALKRVPPRRIEQAMEHRVLLANLSGRLEALAAAPGRWLGVVNVIQVFCSGAAEAARLACWLNSAPVNDWMSCWYDPLRLSGQLSITRGMVRNLPAPPDPAKPGQAEDARLLEDLGRSLGEGGIRKGPAWIRGERATALMAAVDEIAERWLSPERS